MPLRDTSPKAREVYLNRLRVMTPAERLNIGVALWRSGHALQRAAILHKNPNADEDEILFQIAVTRFGAELARKIYKRS